MGAVLRKQNALPQPTWFTKCLTAKDGIGNAGAGRAAKGENPLLCANGKTPLVGVFFVGVDMSLRTLRIIGGSRERANAYR